MSAVVDSASSSSVLAADVVVIGAGIAGFVAAARARALGKTVVLVQRTGGGTALSSGAIDAADDVRVLTPGPTFDALDRGPSWRIAAERLAAAEPRHPYARVGPGGRERLPEALALLQRQARAAALVRRDDGRNHVVATVLGTVKRAALVQRSQLLDIDDLVKGAGVPPTIGVVEPADLGGFTADTVARMLAWCASLAPQEGQAPVGARALNVVPIRVARTLPDRDVASSARDLALRLDAPGPRRLFVEALLSALAAATPSPTHLLVPAILGLEDAASCHAEVEAAAGRPVRELLALPPSAAGERLARALAASARDAGVTIVHGTAIHARTEGKRVRAVKVETDAGSARPTGESGGRGVVELNGAAFVLATGRFFAGGIERDQAAREPLFGLPVVVGGAPLADTFIGLHLGDVPEASHAVFRAGVAVDEELRPVDDRRRVLLGNVACAGTVIEGWDPAKDGAAGGVSALTGLLAAETAAAVR
jgi:glycerol-3-phosphate dehydrogenase subunit B